MRKLRDPHYQGRRNPLEKWIQIKDRIDPRVRNIVDIGCNLGHIANAACDSGYLCLGVDVKSGVIQAARKTFSDNKELAFMAVEDSLESLEKLPTRDVSFLFSVHHQFYRYHGRDGCKNFLKRVAISFFFRWPRFNPSMARRAIFSLIMTKTAFLILT